MVDWHAKSPEWVRAKQARGEPLSWRERTILRLNEPPVGEKEEPSAARAAPPPAPVTRTIDWRRVDWAKVGSLRVAFGALIPAAIIGALLGEVWRPLVYLWIPVFIAWWLFLVLDPSHVVYCPHCRKRVKVGASVCHHCGRDAVPEA